MPVSLEIYTTGGYRMTCVNITGWIGLLLAFTLVQGPPKTSAPQDAPARTKPGDQPSPALHVDVDLVLLQATVTDRNNKYVNGLGLQNFRVWEDKVEQRVEYISAENVPLSVGIIFDVSGSMQEKLANAREAANTFLRVGDREDEYFLVQFSDSPQVLQSFTTDITKLQNRLLLSRAKGSTSLYDALYLGMEMVTHGSNGRKALLLITDGEDNHSRYSLSDVKSFAKEHDVMIYSIGIQDDSDLQISGENGRAVLQELSELTGGAAFFPRSSAELPAICMQIGIDLKNQYVLGYHPLNLAKDGKWRKVQVKVVVPKGMSPAYVRAKTGYYAPGMARAMK
jgi:Ca-activated chloride channel family protein